MKKSITQIIVFAIAILAQTALHAQEIYPGKAAPIEDNFPIEFPYESKYFEFGKEKVHYVESGEGETVLLLHGIPSSSYVWRNVINKIDDDKHVIALDWIGYGKSSFPEDRNVPAEVQLEMLTEFIEANELKDVTIWMHDLGSIIGMLYATRNPENVNAIALFEAPFMPTAQFYKQLPASMKAVMKITRKEKRAEKLYVKKNFVGKIFPNFLTARKLSKEEKKIYGAPFEDEERRYIMLTGPDPAQMSFDKGRGTTSFENIIAEISTGMANLDQPILYFYAKKGVLNQKESVAYARATFKNYQEVFVGKGKHFLTESHPKLMSDEFNKWHENLKK
jgi:haloalkane dehalogenase